MRVGSFGMGYTHCLRHRNRLVIVKYIRDSPHYHVSDRCPIKIEDFISKLLHVPKFKGGMSRIINQKYNKYIEALLMGCSLSQVLKRMREDGLL